MKTPPFSATGKGFTKEMYAVAFSQRRVFPGTLGEKSKLSVWQKHIYIHIYVFQGPKHSEPGLYLLTNLNKDLRHLEWDVGHRHDGFGLSCSFQQCFHPNEAVIRDT